ncbi:MAG: glycyl-radical enzyme activating protein [Candidatus Latescibacterota bacterium]
MTADGIIFDLKKFAIHDGPGIRTTVFFKGCPLNCWWCHNPEGVNALPAENLQTEAGASPHSSRCGKEAVGRRVTVESLLMDIEKDVIFYDQSGGGVTMSGGEPLMQDAFLAALLRKCRERRIHTVVDTSGYAPWETIARLCGLVDLFLFDVKLASDEDHIKYTGVSNRLIVANLAALAERSQAVTVRIPLIPDITDTDANLQAIAVLLAKMKNIRGVDLLPYNKMGEEKFRRFSIDSQLGPLAAQPQAELKKKAELFESSGYRVKIGG